MNLPDELREKAVTFLISTLDEDFWLIVRSLKETFGDDWAVRPVAIGVLPLTFHFYEGMSVRNLLRTIIKDDELPPVRYGDDEVQNWDDYYIEVIDEAYQRIMSLMGIPWTA